MWVAVGIGGIEPDELEQPRDGGTTGAVASDRVGPERLFDDPANGHAWVERCVGILEDDLHLAAHPSQLFASQAGHSRPRKRTEPAVGRRSCRTAYAVVDLPDPDSPTRPSV